MFKFMSTEERKIVETKMRHYLTGFLADYNFLTFVL